MSWGRNAGSLFVLSLVATLFWQAQHYANAQTGCVPNPNLTGPPFVNGCPLPPAALNNMLNSTRSPSYVISPTGNTPSTLAALAAQGVATSPNGREFEATFGITSTIGDGGTAGNDKVALYTGAVCGAGSANCWSYNPLITLNPGFFGTTHVSHAIEVDVNNNDKNTTTSAEPAGLSFPYSTGIEITGTGFTNTTALDINGGSFQFGYTAFGAPITQSVFYEHVTSAYGIDLTGVHGTAGIHTIGSAVPLDIEAGSALDQRLIFRGHVTLGSGVSLYSVDSANTILEGLEIAGSPILLNGATKLATFHVAALPTCNAGAKYQMYSVVDISAAPTYRQTGLAGSGSVAGLVFCNGAAWEAH